MELPEILFRARSIETGEWIEGNYMHNKRKGEFHAIINIDTNESHKIYRESLEIKNFENKWKKIDGYYYS
jgi:hypothetical protein